MPNNLFITIAEKHNRRIYIQVTYLLATEEIINREYGALMTIRDFYPKKVVSMDRLPIGTRERIEHQFLLDFLQENED